MTGEDCEARKDEHRPDWPGYKTDHLPECPWHEPGRTLNTAGCICLQLRACEQRVLLSKPNIELSAVYGYEAGRSDGLSAARDAVAALKPGNTIDPDAVWMWEEALAAIDALRGGA